jgi:HAD superfamily hydrolase (TIGR01509 family)
MSELVERAPAIAGIIFDMDGVLIDSEHLWDQARGNVVHALGGRWDAADQRNVMGHNSQQWAAYIQQHCGIRRDARAIIDIVIAELIGLYRQHGLPLLPGAIAVVQALAAHYPLGVASSAARPIIDFVLDAAGIRFDFTTVVSADEVLVGKPAPDVYLRAAQQLGIAPPHILVFEDSSSGILAAQAAGMRVIALPNRTYPPASQVLALASIVCPSLAEVDLRQIFPEEATYAAAPTGI